MKISLTLVALTVLLPGLPACGQAAVGMPLSITGISSTGAASQSTPSPSSSTPMEASMTFQLTSSAFTQGNSIPPVYTCTGRNISPPLAWSDPPAGTQSFALILDDPDAPGGTFTHWVLYNLPASTLSLAENVPATAQLPDGSLQGKNSFGKSGYGGPCPPSGTHRYFFKLYSLDSWLGLPSGASVSQLQQAMQGHILAGIELMGTYQK